MCPKFRVFLADDGQALSFDKMEAIRTVEPLAAGQLSETALADWFRIRLV